MNLATFKSGVSAEKQRVTAVLDDVCSTKHPLCNVILRVPGSEAGVWVSIGSNSAFLRAKSGVFAAMWESDSSGTGVETLDIADCSEVAIRALNAVAFNQFHKVEITAQNVAELLYAAHKYDFKIVLDCCERIVEDSLAKKDIKEWLPVVSALYATKLTDYASKIAAKAKLFEWYPVSAFLCESAKTFPLPLFRELLGCDKLGLSEEDIWELSVAWAKHNAGLSQETEEEIKMSDSDLSEETGDYVSVLRSLTAYIRFPLMKQEFFMQNIAALGILSDADIGNVCMAKAGLEIEGGLFCSSTPRCSAPPTFDVFHPDFFKVTTDDSTRTQVLETKADGTLLSRYEYRYQPNGQRALFGCSNGWRTGVHKWRITIQKTKRNIGMGFGVSHNCEEYRRPSAELAKDRGEKNVSHVTHVFWGNAMHYRMHNGCATTMRGGIHYAMGDSVTLTLDCNEWTLTARCKRTECVHPLEHNRFYFPVVTAFDNSLQTAIVEWL